MIQSVLSYRIKSKPALLASISGVTFLSSYTNGATTVLLPTIGRDLKMSDDQLVWPLSIYALTLACFLPLAGRIADVYGRRVIFLLGTTHFTIFSLAFSLSPNFLGLTVFSALMGFGPAAFTPAAVGILGSTFTGKAKSNAFAIMGAGQPLGFIVGLFLGAFFASSSWRIAFFLQTGLGGILCITSFFCLPKNQEVAERDRSVDWVGGLIVTTGLLLLSFALTDSQSAPEGFATPYIIAFLPLSFLLLGVFWLWELRLERMNRIPMIAPSLFKTPYVKPVLMMAFWAWAAFNSTQYWVNLYMQNILGYSPVKTAVAFLPEIVAGIFYNILPSLLMARVKGQVLILAGLFVILPSAIMFSEIKTDVTYWAMLFPIVCLLPGPDLSYVVASVRLSQGVDPKWQSMAGALFQLSTRLATSLGLALTSTIANQITRKELSHGTSSQDALLQGYKVAGYFCVASVGMAILLAAWFCRGMGYVISQEPTPPIELENKATESQ